MNSTVLRSGYDYQFAPPQSPFVNKEKAGVVNKQRTKGPNRRKADRAMEDQEKQKIYFSEFSFRYSSSLTGSHHSLLAPCAGTSMAI